MRVFVSIRVLNSCKSGWRGAFSSTSWIMPPSHSLWALWSAGIQLPTLGFVRGWFIGRITASLLVKMVRGTIVSHCLCCSGIRDCMYLSWKCMR